MKNIFKLLMLAVLITAGTSCTDSDALIDQVVETVDTESGAVVRTLVSPPELVSLTNPANNVVAMTLEIQQGNGSFVPDFKEVRAYVALFQDQDVTTPIVDGNGSDIGEVLFATLPSSDFTLGSNQLPVADVSIPTQSIVDALPADAVLTTPSFIAIRLELEMADGTVFTNTSVGTTISGGIYFNAPFFYRLIFLPV